MAVDQKEKENQNENENSNWGFVKLKWVFFLFGEICTRVKGSDQ